MQSIMAINCGSSSIKCKLFRMPTEQVLAEGMVEKIGMNDSHMEVRAESHDLFLSEENVASSHAEGIQRLLELLAEQRILTDDNPLAGVGHRVVHGGETFTSPTCITDEVIRQMDSLSELAPLHNPANLIGIQAFSQILPTVPQVAVFDTAFHQSMDERAFLYSIPYEYYVNYGIRKYGFHGISHQYVSQRASEMLNIPLNHLRLISCHLGNGASITAIDRGKSIDTSMGFTPLAGLVMGTRSGDIDPALIPYMMKKTAKSAEEVVYDVLNKQSGMLGITGVSSDIRDIEDAAKKGNRRAELALDVFAYQIHYYIGSYAARMDGVDAIIFTAGIGENSVMMRKKIIQGLEFMGVYADPALNVRDKHERFLSAPYSPVKLLVIPTNEELMIARETMRTIATEKMRITSGKEFIHGS